MEEKEGELVFTRHTRGREGIKGGRRRRRRRRVYSEPTQ